MRSAPGMGRISTTRATTTPARSPADVLDSLDDQPERVELGAERGDGGQVLGGDAEGCELAQPRKRDTHGPPLSILKTW